MVDKTDALDFDKQICFSLYSAANSMVRAYRPLLQSLDLTYLQYIVMMVLWEEEGISISSLGDKLHLDSGTLTPLLKRLESKGLLLRRVSKKDERVKSLDLTESGRALKNKASNIPEKILCKTNASYESLQQLKKQCDQLLSALNGD